MSGAGGPGSGSGGPGGGSGGVVLQLLLLQLLLLQLCVLLKLTSPLRGGEFVFRQR